MKEFLERYRNLTDDQLAGLWRQAGKLTPEAQQALKVVTDERDLKIVIEDPVIEDPVNGEDADGTEWATHSARAGWLAAFYPGNETDTARSHLLDGAVNELTDYRQREVGLRMVMAIILGLDLYYWVMTTYYHFVFYERPFFVLPLLVGSLLAACVYALVQQPRWGLVLAAGYVGVLLGGDILLIGNDLLTTAPEGDLAYLLGYAEYGYSNLMQWLNAAVFVLTPYLSRALRVGYPTILRWVGAGIVVGAATSALYFIGESI